MPKKTPRAVPAPAEPSPVLNGKCFATFLHEAQAIGNEVAARRVFQEEIAAFFAERGLTDDFEAWRAARATPAQP